MKNIFLVIFFTSFFGTPSLNKAADHTKNYLDREACWIATTCAHFFEKVTTVKELCEATDTIIESHPNLLLFRGYLEDDSIDTKWVKSLERDLLFILDRKKYDLSLEESKEYAQEKIAEFFIGLRGIRYKEKSSGKYIIALEKDDNDVFLPQVGPGLNEEERAQATKEQFLRLWQERNGVEETTAEETESKAKRQQIVRS